MSFVYMASPYTPHHGENIEERVHEACKAAAKLMGKGFKVFAPIPHSHYIASHLDGRHATDHEFWMRQDLTILQHASSLFVLVLPGWKQSLGVKREIEAARAIGLPVIYIEP